MGQLTNLYVSQSYQGLLKMTDSTNGLTNTLQTVQTGDGDNSPLQMSLTQVNITGSLTVNGQPISVDTGSLVTTASFNAYTSSVNTHLAGLDIETGSLQNQINGLATTGSLSGYTTVTTFNNYTGSNDAKVNDLISKTGSYATITGQTALSSSIATTDLNQDNRITALENVTGSINRNGLITTGSIGGSQSITGSLNVGGIITATSASFTYVNTVYETASVIYSSGSNQLGDASNDTQTLYGTVNLPDGTLNVNNGGINVYNQYGAINIQLNQQGSGSQYPNYGAIVDSTTAGGNGVFAGYNIADVDPSNGNTINGGTYAISSYQGVYGNNYPEGVLVLAGGGQYNGDDTSIGFRNGGIDIWKPTNFKANVGITGSLTVNGSPITPSNRNGLITTGSVGGEQLITGSLKIAANASSNPVLYLTGAMYLSGTINNMNFSRGPVDEGASLAYGFNTLTKATSASNNTAIGASVLSNTVSGSYNLGIGSTALLNNVGNNNMAVGAGAMIQNTVGENNTALGGSSLSQNRIGNHNLAIGRDTMYANQSGSYNTAIGGQALYNNISGSSNVAIGYNAGLNETGDNNFYLGNRNISGVDAERSGSLMWGKFNSTTANQTLQINAATDIRNNTIVTGSIKVATTQDFNNITLSSLGPSFASNQIQLTSNFVYISGSGWIDVKAPSTRITGSLLVGSGSLSTISQGTTIQPSLYLTSSDAGQSNQIKGWGDNPGQGGASAVQANYTGSLRITGSNNTVSMPQIRATGLGGGTDQQGYISGSDNIIASNQAGIFLNTGSLLYPKLQSNILGSNSLISMNFTTSSLAGGHPVLSNNLVFGGSIQLNSNSGSITTVGQNFILGGQIASTQNFVTNTRPSISTNNVIGNVTLNHISSSINYSGNYNNSPVTINNYSSSSFALSSTNVTNNLFLGGDTATGPTIFISGSMNTSQTRTIASNLLGGRNLIVSSSAAGTTNNQHLLATIAYGQGLYVSASHAGTLGGSAFFGRFNDTGSLSSAQDNIFVVGTGTGVNARRNGLWIDSSSTTNISGSLSVTGSVVGNGNVSVTGSIASTKSFGQVTLASNQTVTAASDTVVNFDTVDFDPNSWWNSTSKTFTPTIAGYYEFTVEVMIGVGTGNGQMNLQLNKNNGTQTFIWQDEVNKNINHTGVFSKILYMNGSTDNVKVTFYTSSNNGSQDLQGGNGSLFNIKLL